MQDMFENAKRAAASAVERAAWEADKLRRSGLRQHDAELALRERTALLEQLATTVVDLDKRGQLNSEPLRSLAQRLRGLDTEIARASADIRAIRDEVFVPGSISISVSRKGDRDTAPCSTCGQPVRRNAAFCSACGARQR